MLAARAPSLTAVPYTKWSDRLALDIALLLENSGDTLKSVLEHHQLSVDQFVEINTDPLFHKKVEQLRVDVREKGMTFRVRARAQAEELLLTSWTLIHSPDVSAAVKADLIKSTVKWGGLEPKDSGPAGGGGGVSIQINFNDQKPTAVVSQPLTLENDHDQHAGTSPAAAGG